MPLRLNAEKEGKSVAARYKVEGFPTILFVDGTGKVVHTIVGYLPPADFAAQMELANLSRDLPALQRRVQANPSDAKALSDLVAVYASQKRGTEMESALAKFRIADKAHPSGLAARTLNAAGDYYQLNDKPERAIPLFGEAAKVATNPRDVGYSLLSQAACYLATGDKKSAIPVLQRLIGMGDAAKDWMEPAKSMLEAAKKG